MKTMILVAAALAAHPAAAHSAGAHPAATDHAREEASIPFVRSNGILDWEADGDRGLYIRSMSGDWYYARTAARCGRLESAISIGFETRVDQVDRYSVLRIEGWRCPLVSVVRAEAPPSARD